MTREEREKLNQDIIDLFVNKLKLIILTDEEPIAQSEDFENNVKPI